MRGATDKQPQRSNRKRTVAATAAAAIVVALSGCGSDDSTAEAPSAAPETTAPTTTAAPAGEAATNETTAPPTTADTADFAEWQQIEVTDTTGETFTIADLVGRPVLVENFATWCSKCRSQLESTQAAAEAAGDDAVVLALSVETDLSVDDMAGYAADNDFTAIRFAVMSPELLAAMNDAFGTTALNPPSTPKVVVAADGTAGELTTGPESSDEILASLGIR